MMADLTADIGLTGERVCVTGGAGFIGGALAAALVGHNDVRVVDDLSVGDADAVPDEATLIEGDIREAGVADRAIEGVDVVFHEAGQVSVEKSVADPLASHAVNVEGTLNVLEAARDAGARVVVASSAAVYGQPESVPIHESHPTDPCSPYGLEKLVADQYARLYADLYDVPAVSLRYFNVFGPGQTGADYAGVVSTFLGQARSGEPLTVNGDGSQTRDFVHVRDVVQANLRAAVRGRPGAAYNVGTGASVSVTELAEAVLAVTGADSDIVHTDTRPGDIEHSRADIGRARSELGYEPTVSLREGLRSMVGREPRDNAGEP